jgi:hypothetical protein
VARILVIGALVAGGVLIAIFAGWGGLLVYLFFVAVAGAAAYAAGVGGDWLQRSSRGRFDDRDR